MELQKSKNLFQMLVDDMDEIDLLPIYLMNLFNSAETYLKKCLKLLIGEKLNIKVATYLKQLEKTLLTTLSFMKCFTVWYKHFRPVKRYRCKSLKIKSRVVSLKT